MVFSVWQTWRTYEFSCIPFGLDKWFFSMPTGWKLRLGFWVKITRDEPDLPSSSDCGVETFELYEDLRHPTDIRLLKVHTGKQEDPVKVSLVTVSLTQAPSYEALSYVWGGENTSQRNTISVNGRLTSVRANVFGAIRQFRSSQEDKILWVDALCINQQDLHERNHQVSLMADIYQTAENVFVYLGLSNSSTEDGMRTLRYFTDLDNTSDADAPWKNMPIEIIERSLTDILTRSWFERVWTVQEVTLARKVTLACGEHRLSWKTDLRTMKTILFRIKAAVISPDWVATSGNFREPWSFDWSPLVDILETQMRQAARREQTVLRRNTLDVAFDFRRRKCLDYRDKYFAILGIVENDQGSQLKLSPDYTEPVEAVHQRFTSAIWEIMEM